MPLGSLLQATAHRLLGELDRALTEAGLTDVRSAHAALFLAIDAEGNRATELAERAGLTKQAMGEQIRSLEHRGYVEVGPDPSDGRARLVRLTEKGWQGVEIADAVITRFDTWLDARLGADVVADLRRGLGVILAEPTSAWQLPEPLSD